MRLHHLLVLLLSGAATVCADAQSPTRVDVGDLLVPIRAEADVPALAACVVRGGNVVARGAVGLRARGSDAGVTTPGRGHRGWGTQALAAPRAAP
ncbi:MAG: methylmalonyl-CoA mutase, partial [Planctomycetota bacterium]